MITEAVFSTLFLVPTLIVGLLPSFPNFNDFAGLTSILELFAIANQFFPVGKLLSYMSVWLALNIIALTKSFIDWILSLIPFY